MPITKPAPAYPRSALTIRCATCGGQARRWTRKAAAADLRYICVTCVAVLRPDGTVAYSPRTVAS